MNTNAEFASTVAGVDLAASADETVVAYRTDRMLTSEQNGALTARLQRAFPGAHVLILPPGSDLAVYRNGSQALDFVQGEAAGDIVEVVKSLADEVRALQDGIRRADAARSAVVATL